MNPRRSLSIFLIVVFALVLLGCGSPDAERVKNDFRAENPSFTPISAGVGEGHSDAAYFHIRYLKPGDDQVYEQVWLYLREADEKFKLTDKGAEKAIN